MMENNQKEEFKKALESARITSEGYGRFTKEEVDWIRTVFKDNERALIILKKVFLPRYQYDDPMGSIADLWLEVNLDQIPEHERMGHIMARNKLLIHIEKMVNSLWAMSQVKDESPDERAERLKKDSNK